MTLLQLTYFNEVCRTQNFTKAAENLQVTQPTITNAVRDLEKEFHIRLLERESKGIRLTEAGQTFLEMSIRLLDYSDWMRLVMQDKAGEQNCLRLGIPNMSNAACFPWFFSLLHQAHPEIEIITSHALSNNLLDELARGRLNMLIIPYHPDENQYQSLVLLHTRFLFCVSSHHPLADRASVSFQDICHIPILSFFGDRYLYQIGLPEKYQANGNELQIVYRCSQINTLLELIRSGEGCGFLLEEAFKEEDGIVGLPLEEDIPVTLYLVWTKESARLSSVKKVLDVFRH